MCVCVCPVTNVDAVKVSVIVVLDSHGIDVTLLQAIQLSPPVVSDGTVYTTSLLQTQCGTLAISPFARRCNLHTGKRKATAGLVSVRLSVCLLVRPFSNVNTVMIIQHCPDAANVDATDRLCPRVDTCTCGDIKLLWSGFSTAN